MRKIKCYLLCLVVTFVLIILYFFANAEAKVVLNFSDTYYVIAMNHIVLIMFYLFGLFSIIYFLIDFFDVDVSKKSIYFHFYGTILSALSFFYFVHLSNELPAQEKGFDYLQNTTDYNMWIFIVILIALSLQLFFFINIFVILIKKMRLLRASKLQ